MSMRVTGMLPQAAVPAAPRSRTRGAPTAQSSAAKPSPEPLQVAADPGQGAGSTGTRLPLAVADRLAGILASDPGLAEAVTAQLPAARRASARDLEAYSADASASHVLDIQG
jgi:hypothetical protein